jgi:formate-dependent nitrite reductase membrane component NrfD
VKRTDAFARVAAVNAYHVCGVLFAVWAVLLSFFGITREDFPGTPAAQRAVGVISVLLAIATIGSAIYTGATEDDDEGDGGEHALILRI